MAEKDTKKSSSESKKYMGFTGKTGIEAAAVEKAFIKQFMKSGPSQGPSDDQSYAKAIQAAVREARSEIKRETKGKAPDAYAKGGVVAKALPKRGSRTATNMAKGGAAMKKAKK